MDNKLDLIKGAKATKRSYDRVSFGLWFLKNRRHLFLGLIFFLLVGSIILYSTFFYNLYTYIKYTPEERESLGELSLVDVALSPARLAKPLKEEGVQSFFHGNRYDLIARVSNPNDNFFAGINYCFLSGEEEVSCGQVTLFPNEDRYVLDLAVERSSPINNLRFYIKNVSWERVDSRRYGSWNDYYNERSNFIVSDINFEIVRSSDLSFSSRNNLSFRIKNNSPYNYWEVPISIILMNQGGIVGVNSYVVFEFMSLQEKNIELFWSNSLSRVDNVLIVPNLEVLREDNYIRYR